MENLTPQEIQEFRDIFNLVDKVKNLIKLTQKGWWRYNF